MTFRRWLGLMALVLLAGFLFGRVDRSVKPDPSVVMGEVDGEELPVHPSQFFESEWFFRGVYAVADKSFGGHPNIRGGVVPHHLYPSFILADFFKRLAVSPPKTLVILGPNHLERGEGKFLTGFYGWETPFGQVRTNRSIILELVDNNLAVIDENVLPLDHSVAGILPYVKYYLPDTKIVPILLSGFINEAEADQLADFLSAYISEDTVLVAAVDFSHYLNNPGAKKKDAITLTLMQQRRYREILSLNNHYLDSPAAMVTLLKTMDKIGAGQTEVLHQTNSGELQANDSIETTSYFSIVFY